MSTKAKEPTVEWLSENQSLKLLADLIQERTGIFFDDHRLDFLGEKISPLLTAGHFDSVLDYYYLLRYDENAEVEWQHLQTALAVTETYFSREMAQIQAAAKIIIPDLQMNRAGRPVRIWHAACATGEEPLTMAMVLDQMGCLQRGPVEILATDFNRVALDRARSGIFRPRSFRQFSETMQGQYFTPAGHDQWRIVDSIHNRVTFTYLNLLDKKAMDQILGYDIIFCRNAFIYFSTKAIEQVIKCFYQTLVPKGFLFVAAAESLLRWSHLYELAEVGEALAYKKIDNTNGRGEGGK